jgi:hypothetical protein
MKIVVFDLDETLGYFVEFGIFWDCLHKYLIQHYDISNTEFPHNDYTLELNQEHFNAILNLYPEFLRPNIIPILNYLKQKKQSKCCKQMMVYTNNQGPRKWAHKLINYFESKINYKLFDQIIAAFKINGKRVEICRTSHNKSYKDLIKCTKIPLHAEICFLDDNYFSEMTNQNVYYINLKPYVHDIKFEEMVERFMNTKMYKNIVRQENDNNDKNIYFQKCMMDYYEEYNFMFVEKNKKEYEIDQILGKTIMMHLHTFFNKSLKENTNNNNKTKKNNPSNKNRTRRYH